jgi:signal transduction histidine kinase
MDSVVETVSMLGLRQRRRLERDLHDGAQQRLVSLALTLRVAREKLGPDAGEAGRLLDRSRQELDEALKELRELARGIRPTVLSDRGLGAPSRHSLTGLRCQPRWASCPRKSSPGRSSWPPTSSSPRR